MLKNKKIARIGEGCVACGGCVKACTRTALTVDRGMRASVDESKCIGCGKCEKTCHAGVIELTTREAASV